MKKPLPLLLFLFVVVFQAHAQIAVGPKVGINWNSFRGNKAFDVVPGFNIGGFGKYTVLPFLTAKAELLYNQQGANLTDYSVLPYELRHHSAKVVFHQIQVPVLAEFGLPSLSEEPLQPKISVGAFYAFNMYSRERWVNVARVRGYDPVEYKGHENVTDQWKRSQYGLIGAVGAEIKIMSMPVYLEFRYTHNLPSITKSGMTRRYNLRDTFEEWDKNNLKLGTVSFNVAVTVQYF